MLPHEIIKKDIAAMFAVALEQYGAAKISDYFGLHVNTINRWIKEGVPINYFGDFMRLLGGTDTNKYAEELKDGYYTKPSIALKCFTTLKRIAATLKINLSAYSFIEPSVGRGAFYNILPTNKRIGVDINPQAKNLGNIIIRDYLTWQPKENLKYVVVGNPPFGSRGHLALQFINHSYKFADIVAFILPQLFNSDGKGVPAKRVRGYSLAFSKNLPSNAFTDIAGGDISISTIFQVWTKINVQNIALDQRKTCDQFIKIYALSDGGTSTSTRNKKMLYACDVYLPSSCFRDMRVYYKFEDLPHRRGYGVKILKEKALITKLFEQCDLSRFIFKSTNGALNLRKSIIESILTTNGFYDKWAFIC